MADEVNNKYGVKVPDEPGYPQQEHVDGILNGIDDCPSCKDIEELIALGVEKYDDARREIEELMALGVDEAKAYVLKKFVELQYEMNIYFDKIFEQLEKHFILIEPLINPPKTLDEVIEYCEALVEYYFEPYVALVKQIKFYKEFCEAVTQAIKNKATEYGCFNDLETLLPSAPDIKLPELPDILKEK